MEVQHPFLSIRSSIHPRACGRQARIAVVARGAISMKTARLRNDENARESRFCPIQRGFSDHGDCKWTFWKTSF
jgi:hypothetical protein